MILCLVVGTLAGAVWAGIAGILKATVGAHEVISTIMLNWIAIWVGSYLFGQGGPLQNSAQKSIPISNDIVDGAKLPVFWGLKLLQGLSIGIFIALAMLIVYWIIINRTTLGFEVRAVGFNPEAARYGGISVARNYFLAMAISGAFAGLAGAVDITGWEYRIGQNDIQLGGARSASSAWRRRCSAATRRSGSGFASLLFGALINGTSGRQLDPSIFRPDLAGNLTTIIQGLVILFVGLNLGGVVGLAASGGGAHDAPSRHASAASSWTHREDDRDPRDRARRARVLARAAAARRRAPLRCRSRSGSSRSPPGSGRGRASERRVGGGAVAAGMLGIVARRARDPLVVGAPRPGRRLERARRRHAALRDAADYAAIGGLFCERSGVINVALEGMLLTGAFFGIWGAIWAHIWAGSWAWVVGLGAAALAGMVLATVHAIWAIHLKVDQIISGIAINFLALGITGYLFIEKYGDTGTPGDVPTTASRTSTSTSSQNWYFIGPIIGQLNLMIWLRSCCSIGTYIFVFRTPFGLRLRAVGEHPRAADTVGISVYKMRYIAVIASGAIAAMGGAYLSIGFVHSFNEGMTNGTGFIGLAALVFGKWRPFPTWGATLLFGFSSALADRLPNAYGNQWGTLFQALPYLLTLIAVAGVIGRSIGPAAAGRPVCQAVDAPRARRACLRRARGARDPGGGRGRAVPERRRPAAGALRRRAGRVRSCARGRRLAPAGRGSRRPAASAGGGGPRPARPVLAWAGLYAGVTGALALGGLRRASLGAVAAAARAGLPLARRVRDRQQPP